MRAVLTRQSGVTAVVDIFLARPGRPAKGFEDRILEEFNSFEGVKSDPFVSIEIIRKQKPLSAK